MKIAIIGGGIFGVTTAIRLSRNHDVDLFEQNSDILQSASGINQYRLHRGYHYPRSTDTAISAKNSELFIGVTIIREALILQFLQRILNYSLKMNILVLL